ncbi:hypothetical protein BJX66DRAFT_290674 [Aspergillus keveii]|uniref:RNA polymerase II degradation factor 1 n=1 Tax=Aspergillus keveii TaxID=714993 RepID=A0ABR4GPK3_9EURO
MSEVQSRSSASRGRVSARGGRGGYSSRGGRGGSRSTKPDTTEPTFEDEGELGQMKKKYSDTLPMLQELFPDWTDEDLVFALEDANGDLEQAIDRISEGAVSQWGEVKKKTTDRSRLKAKEVQNTPIEPAPTAVRGGRGRGGFEGRGRARGDRGRGGRGGRAGAHANGTRTEKPAVPAEITPVVDSVTATSAAPAAETATLETVATSGTAPAMPEGTKKGWASLFAKPAAPPQKKPAPAPVPAPAAAPAPASVDEKLVVAPVPEETPAEPEAAPAPAPAPVPVPGPVPVIPITAEKPAAVPQQPTEEPQVATPPSADVEPSKDDLTKNNLAQIPDVSPPVPTATAASTIGSTIDPSIAAASTPARPTPSAFPSSALKQSIRTPGAQRRVMEQQEAVVMPGNHAVDRAAVQFGSMGLNEADIDENREDTETRAQPPQHSPVAPRASLPPSTQAPQVPTEVPAVSRPAPGLPPVPQASAADNSFSDFARYTDSHKPYDPFTQQVSQPQPQVQEPFANQAPIQPTATTGSDFSPFYAGDQRLPYTYYNQFQDASLAQRAAAGFGVSGAEAQQPQVPTSQPPSRYSHVDAPNSGHTTPNPTLPGATQQTPSAQHIPGQGAAAHGYGYPYQQYYSNPHYASYVNQYGRSRPMYDDARRYEDQYMPQHTQYGYGSQYGPYGGGKGGMYGQPHGFSYDHSSSPATAGTFNQAIPGRDSVYGRTGSAQPSESQQSAAGASAFSAGMGDVFSRGQGSFGQNQPITQQTPVTSEETKAYDASKTGGPSPSLSQANRPGSATNTPGQSQSQAGLPPLQGQQGQQGFGGYPHLNPQYGGLGGLGGHQGAGTQGHHQATGYGNYGGASFGNYYGNTGRGGWGGNYGH